MIENEAQKVQLLDTEAEFPTVYDNRTSTSTVRLLNLGTEDLEVLNVPRTDAFAAYVPDGKAGYNKVLNLKLLFEPLGDPGEHEAELEIQTSAGSVFVHCKGTALSTERLALNEDFEDDAENWYVYDRDGDGDAWNLAWNVFGGVPQGHVHGGEECIVSFSFDYVTGDFLPDNWTFSPSFYVPEEGAWLTWWSAGEDANGTRPLGDRYSVYIGEGPYMNSFKMEDYKEVHTETIDNTEWRMHTVNLSDYADKIVHAAFRHHDCTAFYMVKIDDVFVYLDDPTGVEDVTDAERGSVTGREYYSIDGRRLQAPGDGVTIVRARYSDGTSKTTKIIRK